MKVLLLTHVKKVGREGEVVEVSDGFANNSLFPQKKAVQATAKVLNDLKMKKHSEEQRAQKEKEAAISKLQKLDGKKVTIKEKLNPKGTLYHALSTKEVIRAIFEQLKVSIPNTFFEQLCSLKEAGEYDIILSQHGATAHLKVEIVGE